LSAGLQRRSPDPLAGWITGKGGERKDGRAGGEGREGEEGTRGEGGEGRGRTREGRERQEYPPPNENPGHSPEVIQEMITFNGFNGDKPARNDPAKQANLVCIQTTVISQSQAARTIVQHCVIAEC